MTLSGRCWLQGPRGVALACRRMPWDFAEAKEEGFHHFMAAESIQRWKLVQRHALETGALLPLATRTETIRDEGIEFSVRVVEALARKPGVEISETASGSLESEETGARNPRRNPQPNPNWRNPFLPYERDLYVCDVKPHHVCLLNKYQVVAAHLLLVTRDFQRQEAALDEADFAALWWSLSELDGLGFYNGGRIAGASQPHKHLQVIPFLDPRETGFPLLTMWEKARMVPDRGVWRAPLPFPHAAERLNPELGDSQVAGKQLAAVYRRLLLDLDRGDPVTGDPLPYNLLMTRWWMFVVPRVREIVEGISLNALAFAGGLLVRDDHQLAQVRRRSPLSMLIAATTTRTDNRQPTTEN